MGLSFLKGKMGVYDGQWEIRGEDADMNTSELRCRVAPRGVTGGDQPQ